MTDRPRDETQASEEENEHPLAQPTELAGTAEGAIAAEFAARDALEAADQQDDDAG